MKEIETIIQKIEQEVKNQIEEIKNLNNQKKSELEIKYKNLFEEQKKLLELDFRQNLDLAKKRIYTEKFIEYNKKIEEIKNELFHNLLEKIKQSLLNIDKKDYYVMIKKILSKNLFFNEHNYIIFDDSVKLNKTEKQKLVNEVLTETEKKFPSTKIEIKEPITEKFDFGVKIVSKEKSKEFSLNTIIDLIKPLCEEEINKLIFEDQK